MSASNQAGIVNYRIESLWLKHVWISEHFSLPPKGGAIFGKYILYC